MQHTLEVEPSIVAPGAKVKVTIDGVSPTNWQFEVDCESKRLDPSEILTLDNVKPGTHEVTAKKDDVVLHKTVTVLPMSAIGLNVWTNTALIAAVSGEKLMVYARTSVPGAFGGECRLETFDGSVVCTQPLTWAGAGGQAAFDLDSISQGLQKKSPSTSIETGKYVLRTQVWTIGDQATTIEASTQVCILGGAQQPDAPQVWASRLLGLFGAELGQKLDGVADSIENVASALPRTTPQQPSFVSLVRTASVHTDDLAFWLVIRGSTDALSFRNYERFLELALCRGNTCEREMTKQLAHRRALPFNDTDAYRFLKVATEAFVAVNCAVDLDGHKFSRFDVREIQRRLQGSGGGVSEKTLAELWNSYLTEVHGTCDPTIPYLARIRNNLRSEGLKSSIFGSLDDTAVDLPEQCVGILACKLANPCFLELIWSYWHEEAMLVQTMHAVSRRFQNIRAPGDHDPLAAVEIDPLRPLNNLLWGYIQDEQHRLVMARRAYEYDHHYGLRLEGRAVPRVRSADTRSKFLEAFHHLLNLCGRFYQQDDDTTVVADGFPLLNALKEVHLLLAEGHHNQYGDLPTTARIEMLMQQWLLARPEFREFIPSRIMVAYPEPWMDRVDSMKRLQGWTDVSVMHFRNLAVFGEPIIVSIRFGNWNDVNDAPQAANWARFWRAEIQGYIHAYRAVTGVDLTQEPVDSTMPSVHLRNRLAAQQQARVA